MHKKRKRSIKNPLAPLWDFSAVVSYSAGREKELQGLKWSMLIALPPPYRENQSVKATAKARMLIKYSAMGTLVRIVKFFMVSMQWRYEQGREVDIVAWALLSLQELCEGKNLSSEINLDWPNCSRKMGSFSSLWWCKYSWHFCVTWKQMRVTNTKEMARALIEHERIREKQWKSVNSPHSPGVPACWVLTNQIYFTLEMTMLCSARSC